MRHVLSAVLAVCLLFGLLPCAQAELVNIGGRLHYTDRNNRAATEIGIDVSFYNNQIDWNAVRDQGIDFVIIRLGGRGWGTGSIYRDSMADSYLTGAAEAGLKIGAYFYSTAVNATEAVEEAEAALRMLNGRRLDLPLYIDMELSGDTPNGRADTLSAGLRAEIAETFCRTVEAAGYLSGIYAAQGYLMYNLDARAVSYLPLWLANYTVDNLLPDYPGRWDRWQFTDSGRLGGIDGPVDLNLVF